MMEGGASDIYRGSIFAHSISYVHRGTLLQSHTLSWSECTVCNCKTDSLTGVAVLQIHRPQVGYCYTPLLIDSLPLAHNAQHSTSSMNTYV